MYFRALELRMHLKLGFRRPNSVTAIDLTVTLPSILKPEAINSMKLLGVFPTEIASHLITSVNGSAKNLPECFDFVFFMV